MFDLQIVKLGNPTLDLAYFLFSSTTAETRADPSLLTEYHEKLLSNIHTLGESLDYSLQDLESDYKHSKILGFFFALRALPMVLAEKEDMPDMDEWHEKEEKGKEDS